MKRTVHNTLLFGLLGVLSGILTLTGCESGDDTPPDTGDPGTFILDSDTYSVMENGGSVTLTVNRVDGSSGSVTVDYATEDGTATNADYVTTIGTLTFADGVTAQVVRVGLQDDAAEEGTETFRFVLSNPTNDATLGSPSSATISIIDDETTALYDFELLNEGIINGQDNWVEEVTNAFVETDPITLSKVVHPVVVLGGSGDTEITRVNDVSFSYESYNSPAGQFCYETTADDNSLFSLGQDLNQDGMLTVEAGEIGVPFGFWERQLVVFTGNSLVTRSGTAEVPVAVDDDEWYRDWFRICLYVSFVDNGGDGAGYLYYRNLTNGDTSDTYLADLQDLNLKLTNAPDPIDWDAMFLKLRVDSSDLIPKVDNLMPNVPLP